MGPRHVLLTGATGTIGSALMPRFLREPGTEVTMLIRASDPQALAARAEGMHAWWQHAPGDERRDRVHSLNGDIALPGFGLAAQQLEDLARRTTHIVHCAASVNLAMPIEQARATAVLPTKTILSLARRGVELGGLRKVDLVSTVGVWGRTPGLMPERPLPEVSQFHNTYEAAKAEAEKLVWAEGQSLPITVHRPSMVVGETGCGRVIHFQVFYHLCEFLSGARTYGVMPHLGQTRLDTVPVDWVADAIDWASLNPQTAGRVLHLCSGREQAIALPELQAFVRQLWQSTGRPVPRLKRVNLRLLQRLVPMIGAIAGTKARRALRALPPVLEYLAEDQGFGNRASAELFAAAGLPVPEIQSYLDPVLRYYLERRQDPRRRP